jgi:CRISPR-associated protein Csx10
VRFEEVGRASAVSGWREFEEGGGRYESIVVTLLSDAVLRGPEGQISTDPVHLFGVKPAKAFLKLRMVGGFNRKWGLPLPQALALQAGSVFVYGASEIDEKHLVKAISEGVGERRTEGFGRLAVNWSFREKLRRREAGKKDDLPGTAELGPESRLLAKRMAERLLRNRLDEKIVQAINQLEISGSPSNAQLSRLRLAVRRAWREKNNEWLVCYLDSLRRPAREQLKKARIEGKPLFDWLREGILNDFFWEEKICLQPDEIPSVAGVKVDAVTLKSEYTMRLLEGLLKKEIRTKKEGGGGK